MDDDDLPDGLWLDLVEEDYFAQSRLGSSDLAKLWMNGIGYYWQSHLNPHAKERDRTFMDRGHALHCLLLEGDEAYANRFAIEPEKRDYPGLLVTGDDIKEALAQSGSPMPSKATKAELVKYAGIYMRDAPIWDVIYADFVREAGNRIHISAETGRYVDTLFHTVQADETLRALITPQGPRLTELSVFWTRRGVKMRFRFDALYPQFQLDVKSIETLPGDSLGQAAGKRIRNMHYDIQMSLSFEARAAMYRHIKRGRIHGGTPEQVAYLKRFPKEAPRQDREQMPAWGWLWLFCQWPNEQSGRAPELLPVWCHDGDTLMVDGRRKYLHALDTYVAAMKKFGIHQPWTAAHPVHGLRGTGPQLQLPPDYGPPVMPHPQEEDFSE